VLSRFYLKSTLARGPKFGVNYIWRYHWENTHNTQYKQNLLTYNREDCNALKLLVNFLAEAKEKEESVLDINCFIHSKKSHGTPVKNFLHSQLESILKLAHTRNRYNEHRIKFRGDVQNNSQLQQPSRIARKRRTHTRITRTVHVRPPTECPKCGNQLRESRKQADQIQFDLIFTKNGVRKSVTKYLLLYNHCPLCNRYFKSADFSARGSSKKYGQGFKTWIAYQRVAHRLSYERIRIQVHDLFNEDLCDKLQILYLKDVARDFFGIEERIFRKLLDSPFLHVDETQVTVDGVMGLTAKIHLSNMQDLGSRYKFLPLAGGYPVGEQIAEHLGENIVRYGAPLVLKRDNEGTMNHLAVNEVLREFFILPLNSPRDYAPYNGAIEESQRELKGCLQEKLMLAMSDPQNHIAAYAESAVNDLNHRIRPCLNGRTSCCHPVFDNLNM
jgi:hypothetical protein